MTATGPAVSKCWSATADDVDVVLALIESAYRGESSRVGWTTEADFIDGSRTDAATLLALIAPPDRELLIAVAGDGALLACCHVENRGGVAYFGMFAVRPQLQGGGIGGFVLGHAESLARDAWHARLMEMHVIDLREELIAWYERRGYRRTGETQPFPYGERRSGKPRRPDLRFAVLVKEL